MSREVKERQIFALIKGEFLKTSWVFQQWSVVLPTTWINKLTILEHQPQRVLTPRPPGSTEGYWVGRDSCVISANSSHLHFVAVAKEKEYCACSNYLFCFLLNRKNFFLPFLGIRTLYRFLCMGHSFLLGFLLECIPLLFLYQYSFCDVQCFAGHFILRRSWGQICRALGNP